MNPECLRQSLADSGYARFDAKDLLPVATGRFIPPPTSASPDKGGNPSIQGVFFDEVDDGCAVVSAHAAPTGEEWQAQANLISSLSIRAMRGLDTAQMIARTLQSLHSAFPAFRAVCSTLNAAGQRIFIDLPGTSRLPDLTGVSHDLNLAPAYRDALRREACVAIHDAANDSIVRPLHSHFVQSGFAALLDAPLLCAEPTCHILSLCASQPRQWTPFEVQALALAAEHLELLLDRAFVQQERLQAERSLRRANKRIANILDSVTDAYISLDRHWQITYANHKAEEIMGLSRQKLVGLNLWRQYPHLAGYRAYKLLHEAMSRQSAVQFEEFFERSGRWLELNVCPSQDGLSIYARDITARKGAGEALQQGVAALKRSVDGIVQALSFTIGIRDPFTAGHQRRVSILAARVAAQMGLTPSQVEGVRIAGLLHDMGKIAVPAEILCRPGELTSPERSMIQMHPQAGYDILRDIEFAAPVALVALQHHERLDGSGYPQGLKGDAIVLESRIMAVADVVEAMASHRPYRPAIGLQTALAEVMAHRETRYDGRVVDACIELFRGCGFDFEQMLLEASGETEAGSGA